jgi:SAM-dependent methyltransferase
MGESKLRAFVKRHVPLRRWHIRVLVRRTQMRLLCHWTTLKDLFTPNQTGFDALPPASLRYRVHGKPDRESFLEVGQQCSQDILKALRKNGRELASFGSILDFGCGCGRTLLWFAKETSRPRFHGTDIDGKAIAWCQRKLTLGSFAVNEALPPLRYDAGSFDLLYAVSVFTHLDEERQFQWLEEIKRVVRPGGIVVLTIHGETCWDGLPPEHKALMESKGFTFFRADFYKGIFPAWYQDAYHTRRYVDENFSRYFKILDYIPQGLNNHQDMVVLQRE